MGELTDVERPRLNDEMYETPLAPLALGVDPQDGLPRPVSHVSMADSKAAPLSPETFVCMGDESAFVIRDVWGETVVAVPAPSVRYSHADDAYLVDQRLLSEEQWKAAGPARARHLIIENKSYREVFPLRPACQHYKRVLTPFENDPVIRQVARVCRAQRGEEGGFMSLSDQQVLACEHRTPRDFVSEDRLRQFDAARVAEGRKTVEEWLPPP